MKVKVGDKLRCLVDRPFGAGINKGQVAVVTHIDDELRITFSFGGFDNWLGSLNRRHWIKVKLELENK